MKLTTSRTLLFFAVSALILAGISSSCRKSNPDPVPVSYEVRLGAPLDLSGIYSETGRCCQAAIDLAIRDLNALYDTAGTDTRFSVVYKDTGLDTNKAKNAVEDFSLKGITLLIGGPNTSSELRAIKPMLDARNMLNLNVSSTAPSLAIKGDNIFRIIPDDNVQGKATVRMMQYDGLKAVVPVWRNDTYGTGLYETITELFSKEGGHVYPGVAYDQGSTNYPGIISDAAQQVHEALAAYGAGKVGVLLISYQDVSDFFYAAASVNELSTVRWYGCDGNTQKTTVTDDATAAAFAKTVRFVAPVMSIGTASHMTDKARQVYDSVKARTGLDPDGMALSAYDAVMILGRCYDLAGSYDAMAIKKVLPYVAEQYNYMGISRRLNPAGDLVSANYVFWNVTGQPGSWQWQSYATWLTEGDQIVIKP